jgi:hypothetical protein
MRIRNRRLAGLATLVIVSFAIFFATASGTPSATARSLTLCEPTAYTPWVYTSNKTGYSIGSTDGDECGTTLYQYDQQLRNLAGSSLDEVSGWANNSIYYIIGNTVGCAGANVHTFLYINVNGSGRSSTSGNNSNCTY